MTKYFLTLCILLISFFAFGQDKKFGISLQVSSPSKDDISLGWYNIDSESIDGYNLKHKTYAGGLLANYNVNEQTTIRLRFGMTKYYIDEYKDEQYGGVHSVESNNEVKHHEARVVPMNDHQLLTIVRDITEGKAKDALLNIRNNAHINI